MQCLIKWYCGVCGEKYTDWTDETGRYKAPCPKCKDKTDFDEIEELETISVG